MGYDRKYLVLALVYVLAGMGLGIYMAASQNHVQHVTHAHILLVGFVASFVYAVIHRLWIGENSHRLASTQFALHQAGAVTMFAGLLLLYGNVVAADMLDPVLAVASITVMAAALLMLVMVLRARPQKI